MALGKVENEKYKLEIHLDDTGLGDPLDREKYEELR